MSRNIAIIQGHPDPRGQHLGHALADAYIAGAEEARHQVRVIQVAHLDLPLLHSKEEFEKDPAPAAIAQAQETIRWAGHLVILYPLWLGTMPALLKAFFEQTFRPGFAADSGGPGRPWKKRLSGRSARVVVTMGMPAFAYRWYFGAHSLKNLKRNILGFSGIRPVRATLLGMAEGPDQDRRLRWLEDMRRLGREAR